MAIDVFGDVHGHADALERLLETMGYARRGGAYSHPTNTALFLGDLIDAGPRQLDSVDIVRRMRDAGKAMAIMGNHEFNALAYGTRRRDGTGHYRERDGNNAHQHAAFLAATGVDTPLHAEHLDFFRTMPLWTATERLRAVHACWSVSDMAVLVPHVDAQNRLTEEGFHATQVRGSPAYVSSEVALKGPEVDIPDGKSFVDAYGHRRYRVRTKWWDKAATTYRSAALLPDEVLAQIPDDPLPPEKLYAAFGDARPLFFGHYWMRGEPVVQDAKTACLDFSVAKDGVLCAYRFDGEPTLDPANLFWAAPSFEAAPSP